MFTSSNHQFSENMLSFQEIDVPILLPSFEMSIYFWVKQKVIRMLDSCLDEAGVRLAKMIGN